MRTRPGPALVSRSPWTCHTCRGRYAAAARPLAAREIPSEVRNSSSHAPIRNRGKLPDRPARTRFAPSPTGNLHLGSIRTALFNYLLARATEGQFLLRIEDTDTKRTIAGAETALYRDLRWAGLQWDEGPEVGGACGPYKQSQRLPTYQKHIGELLRTGRAYRCFCSPQRIDNLNRRRHEKGLSLGYDRRCRALSAGQSEEKARRGEAHVVRFLAPDEWPRFHDLVYGKTGHGSERTKQLLVDEPVYEDVILMKSDGFPTYHWANVCDDHDMDITHVVRGSEWMASTPLHVSLYQSLNWTPPLFAHVPLLVDQHRQKLSKRNFDSDIASFRDRGILPAALVNFAALLGWSHTQKGDVLSLAQLETLFDLKITQGNTIVSLDKLRYLQQQHARRTVLAQGEPLEQMIRDAAVAVLERYGADKVMAFLSNRRLRDVLASMLQIESLHYYSAKEWAEQCSIFLETPATTEQYLETSLAPDAGLLHALRVAASTLLLAPSEHWTEEVHHAQLRALETPPDPTVDARTWKRELYHYLRWALLGGTHGPAMAASLEIMGREATVRRLRQANTLAQQFEMARSKPNVGHSTHVADADGKKPADKVWKAHSL